MSFEGSFDVVIEGVGAVRGAKVLAAQEGIYIDKHHIPYSTLLGVALRGSILLVIGTQVAMALRGSHEGLATLAAELRGRADLSHLALSDKESLEGERVVFATPVAMSGLVEMERFKGMALAVVTDSALHIFERGGRHFLTPWDRITKVDVTRAKFGRVVRIGSGATQLEVLYLTDAQIQTIRGLAARHSSAVLGVTGAAARSSAHVEKPATSAPAGTAAVATSELRERQDLARRFSIPEFEASLGAMGTGSDRPLGAAIDRLQMSSLLPVGFLEEHLRDLRNIYDGALLRAKRQAAAATDVVAAADALDGRRVWDDLRDSVGVAADATVRSFERQTRRIAANRRLPWRKARRKFMPSPKEVVGVRQRLARTVAEIEQSTDAVSRAAKAVGPAVSSSGEELQEAYDRWHESLRELDQAYATGWASFSREVVNVWQSVFMPKLTRLSGQRRRFLPRPVKVALYFVGLLVVAAVVYLVLTGQLSQIVQFE